MANIEQQETYEAILKLYDLAEELVHTVESSVVADEEAYLELIEPMVEELAEAADILTEEYAALVKAGESPSLDRKKKMEAALQKIFAIVEQCRKYNNYTE